MSSPTARRWVAVLGVLGVGFLACHHWVPTTVPAVVAAPRDSLADYRVTSRTGESRRFSRIFIRNDSLLGVQRNANMPVIPGLPVTDITRVEVRKFDAVATVATVGIIGVIVAVAAVAATDDIGPDVAVPPVGSCPLIYSWDGSNWRLDSGTFGGAITPALARTDIDNLIHARPVDGVLRFRMTAEAPETEHVDAITVLAVDHPVGTTVAPDARANTTFHVIGSVASPVAARDAMRADVLRQVRERDEVVWEPRLDGRDPANPAHLRDGLELTFARPAGDALQLVIDGQNTEWAAALMGELVSAHGRATAPWYDPATTARASAPLLEAQRAQGFLAVTLWDGAAWRPAGVVWEAGPEVAKRQVLPIDVRGIPGTTLRVRLESAPGFWTIDYVGLGPQVALPVTTHVLRTAAVQSARFPDGRERLMAADGRILDMEEGDTVAITVADAPPPAARMTRSYLLRSHGWYRIHGRDDGDPVVTTLATLGQPQGAARLAVTRLNELLAMMAASAHDAGGR